MSGWCVCMFTCVRVHLWRAEDSFMALFLSYRIGVGYWIQDARLAQQVLYSLSHRAVLAHNFSEENSFCWTCGRSFSDMSALTVAEPSSTFSCRHRPQMSSLRSSEMATRGPCFSFQHPHDTPQNPAVTLVPGNPVPFSDLCGYQVYM